MATINKGILGGFSGTIGTVVGANWRGKDIIRSKPKPSSRPATEKQLLQQQKFKLVIGFLNPLRNIQTKYFGNPEAQKSRANLATAYTINEAVEINANIPQLIYSKILITKGVLAGFQNLSVTPQANQELSFSWLDNSAQASAKETDVFCTVVYCEELNEFVIMETITTRVETTTVITLPNYFQGKPVHVWCYFRNEQESSACISQYLGLQNIA